MHQDWSTPACRGYWQAVELARWSALHARVRVGDGSLPTAGVAAIARRLAVLAAMPPGPVVSPREADVDVVQHAADIAAVCLGAAGAADCPVSSLMGWSGLPAVVAIRVASAAATCCPVRAKSLVRVGRAAACDS